MVLDENEIRKVVVDEVKKTRYLQVEFFGTSEWEKEVGKSVDPRSSFC